MIDIDKELRGMILTAGQRFDAMPQKAKDVMWKEVKIDFVYRQMQACEPYLTREDVERLIDES